MANDQSTLMVVSADALNKVIGYLAQRPFNEVAPLIIQLEREAFAMPQPDSLAADAAEPTAEPASEDDSAK